MDDGPIRYLLVFVFLLLCSAYFSATELSLSSVSRIRMMSNADNGDKRAKRVLYLLDNFDSALSTLLIGNNIVNIGCATISTMLANRIWGLEAVAWSTIVTTIVVLFAGEILPKCYAKACTERLILTVSGLLIFLMKVMRPVVFVFSKLSQLLRKPFKRFESKVTVTEEDLYDIIGTIVEEGTLDEDTSELVQSALEFAGTTAGDVLTKWEDVIAVRINMTSDEILDVIKKNGHSRIPVVDEKRDPVGILQIRKYLKGYLKNEKLGVKDIMDKVHYIDAETPVDDLLQLMSENQTHIAIVKGKSGEVLGIITVEDILEELVGEIYDEDDVVGGVEAHA